MSKLLVLYCNLIIEISYSTKVCKKGHIILKELLDDLAWENNNIGGEFNTNIGYKVMFDPTNIGRTW